MAVDYWVNNTLEHSLDFGVYYHTRVTDLCYADDVVVFAELTDTIADALSALNEEASPLGLQINWTKTKIQSLSDFIPSPPPLRAIANQEIEAVTNFIYLGSKITSDCLSDSEITRRMQLTRSSFGRLYPVWRSSKIRLTTKFRILNTVRRTPRLPLRE